MEFNDWIKEYACPLYELNEKVLPLLRETVFHVTRYDSFKKIQETGQIKSNPNGELGYHFSKNSYGRKRGYVCLFDLRNKTEGAINNALECWYFLAPRTFGDKIVFLILNEDSISQLIDHTQAHRDRAHEEVWIPHLECWYPRSLPLRCISKVIVVNIIRTIPENSIRNAIMKAHEK